MRTNGALIQTFAVDSANELTKVTNSGTFTVSGATPAPATSVTVNGQAAQTYGDFTFARTNLSLVNGTNVFSIVASNAYGLTKTNILAVNLPQSVTLGFDNNGNLTNDGVKTLSYNSENQLTNVTVPNKLKKDFVFDGLNRLRIKREFGWIGGAWVKTNETRYVWDGNVIVQLRDSNNVPTLTLTRGLDLSGSLQGAGGIGGLLAMTENSGTSSYYHSDGIGSVTTLMDASENIVGRREMDAFGRTINLTGGKAGVNPFWFSSQLHDEDTDIYSYVRRPYSPTLQRWPNHDPIGERGGINLYGYVHNNPVNRIDPFGLDSYLFFDTSGGPNFAPDAGHVGIGVDSDGGVIRRDAAWGSLGPLANFTDSEDARRGSDIVAVFPNKELPNGQFSDDVIAQMLKNGKSGLKYPYCSSYSAEVMKKGGYDVGRGLTPNSVLDAAKNMPGVEMRDYKSHDYTLNVAVSPTPTITVNTPTIFVQLQTIPYGGGR